jgi:hypothetical protein
MQWERYHLFYCHINTQILKFWWLSIIHNYFQCRESIRDIIIYPHIKFWWYQTMLNFYRRFFMPCFGSHFENGRHLENFENADLLLRWWPIIVSKFMSLFIIHLEVININLRNFNFRIEFYSKHHPLWTPQNMTLTPFTTKLKTLGPTRNIYL